jgi:hypothetical protein
MILASCNSTHCLHSAHAKRYKLLNAVIDESQGLEAAIAKWFGHLLSPETCITSNSLINSHGDLTSNTSPLIDALDVNIFAIGCQANLILMLFS